MKLLFFSYDFPYPTNTGGKNRAYNLLKYAKKNIDISLFSFIRESFNDDYLDGISKIGIAKIKLFKRKKLRSLSTLLRTSHFSASVFHYLYFDPEIEKQLISYVKSEKIDVIHFESFYTAFYIHNAFKELGVKQIFGTENIEFLLYEDYAKRIAKNYLKPLYYFEAKKIKREEIDLLKRADIILSVTDDESKIVKKLTKKDSYIIENGVDLGIFHYNYKYKRKRNNLLFVGNFSYFPNVDGISYFYNEVFKTFPKEAFRLIIVGHNASKLPFRKDSRVETIDFIDDISSLYKEADILISPIKIGGGTNFKVLEAFASGLPVVAHPARMVGLQAKEGKHVLLANNSDLFIKNIELLLEDEVLYEKLAKNARELVEQYFSWEKIGGKLNTIWKTLEKK